MKTKNIFSILFSIMILMTSMFVQPIIADDIPEIKVITFSISETGYVEIYGYVSNLPENTTGANNQIAILLATDDLNSVTSSNANNIIAYVDQDTLGNNNSFLFQFQIADKFLNKELILKMGHVTANTYNDTISVPEDGAPFTLSHVANNDVIYGKDVYSLSSKGLTASNVANSIIYGGNKIYYKIGNNWYDLLNENAIDNSYLVESNAEPLATMESMILRYYYKGDYVFEFDNN